MSLTLNDHIQITPGVAGGRPRIAGHRITVQNIMIWHEEMGLSADDIATRYKLTLADVHAALAYYFDHKEEIEAARREDDALIEEVRRQSPSKLQEKLREKAGG